MNRNVLAWRALVSAVALHVVDEAWTGFLPFYNQTVAELRESLGFFPLPTFSFGVWLGGLIIAVVTGFAMTPLVRRGGRVIRAVVIFFGILMIGNASLHLLGSIYRGVRLPGMWSSPVLLAAAAWAVFQGVKGHWATENFFTSTRPDA